MKLTRSMAWVVLPVLLFVLAYPLLAAEEGPPVIPGINAPDDHPNGCVDCHKNRGEGRDYTLQTGISELAEQGKHPDVADRMKDVPKDCMMCHRENGKHPMGPIMHLVHLTGEDNHYVTHYNASCMSCHQMDPETGTWTVKGL